MHTVTEENSFCSSALNLKHKYKKQYKTIQKLHLQTMQTDKFLMKQQYCLVQGKRSILKGFDEMLHGKEKKVVLFKMQD